MVRGVLGADMAEPIGDGRFVEAGHIDVGDALEAPDALVLTVVVTDRSSRRR